jgi:hypothetical protein
MLPFWVQIAAMPGLPAAAAGAAVDNAVIVNMNAQQNAVFKVVMPRSFGSNKPPFGVVYQRATRNQVAGYASPIWAAGCMPVPNQSDSS